MDMFCHKELQSVGMQTTWPPLMLPLSHRQCSKSTKLLPLHRSSWRNNSLLTALHRLPPDPLVKTDVQPDVPGDPGRGATVFWVVSTTKASTLRPCKSPWERNEQSERMDEVRWREWTGELTRLKKEIVDRC